MIFYIKKIIVFCSVICLATACDITTMQPLYRYGKTKKLQTDIKLNSNDTLVVLVPFFQVRPIKDSKIGVEIKKTRFKERLRQIDYNSYKWFYTEPDTWVKVSKKHKEGIEMTWPSYYQTYFERPIQKLLNNRINYFITKIDNHNRLDIIEKELSIIKNELQDTKVQEVVISDKMCEQLQFYKKRYFLITDVLNYELDYFTPGLWARDVDLIWYRIFLLDIVSKKIMLYYNAAEFFQNYKGSHGYNDFCELKHFVKKIKPILPKKNKHEKH